MEFIKRIQGTSKCVQLVIIGLLIALLGIYFYNTVYLAEESKAAAALAKRNQVEKSEIDDVVEESDAANLINRESDIGVSQSQSVLRKTQLEYVATYHPRYNVTTEKKECPRDLLVAPFLKDTKRPKWLVYLPTYRAPCFHDNGGPKCLPYIHILGVGRSGTSMLKEQLLYHPDILESGGKETPLLASPGFNFWNFVKDFQLVTSVMYRNKNQQGYHMNIPVHTSPTLFSSRLHTWPGSSPVTETPACTLPHTLHAIFPEPRLLVIMSDPKQRLLSHFRQETTEKPGTAMNSPKLFHENVIKALNATNACLKNNTLRSCAFNRKLEKELHGLHVDLFASLYYPYAAEWLSAFPSENIYFVKAEEFYQDSRRVMTDVFKFLELETTEVQMDAIDTKTSMEEGLDIGETDKALWEDTMRLLDDFYAPYNKKLATLLEDDKWLFKSS